MNRMIAKENVKKKIKENIKKENNQNIINRIDIIIGDITKISDVDCIVNAANVTLLGGGGIDAAIHNAAGPELVEECKKLNGCDVGEAKITKAYNIPVKNIIHTVGPIYMPSYFNSEYDSEEEQLNNLINCYNNSLELAKENNLKSIAFPAISCGIHGFPIELAAPVVLKTIIEFLNNNDDFKVVFVLYDEKFFNIYNEKLKEIFNV